MEEGTSDGVCRPVKVWRRRTLSKWVSEGMSEAQSASEQISKRVSRLLSGCVSGPVSKGSQWVGLYQEGEQLRVNKQVSH